MTWFPRLLGIGTAALGATIVVRPETLAVPCGLTDAAGKTSPGMAALCRGIGARDVVSGLALAFAPSPNPLRLAVVGRVATDIGDALLLGSLKPEPPTRSTLATFAAGRGLLSALIGLTIGSVPADDESVEPGDEEAHRRDLHEHDTSDPSWHLRDWVSGIVDEELREAGLVR
ncbi:hypothetical protein [Saccharopolyspora spinosa]|uniref:Uncharacterized protein n=1 Tax=Saccharopolyspora spinosa TaxID=60894 RepID=A0A2N3XXZ6_SACSN|nr:hypothetical protein [Saccharopolyspora spinosa]PKW15563.1 hypothetical protein A8926_3293 [Saccharopolyspora spinosa]